MPVMGATLYCALRVLVGQIEVKSLGDQATRKRIISRADDVSVFVYKSAEGKPFDIIEKVAVGHSSESLKTSFVLTSESIDVYKWPNTVKTLGYYIGTDKEAEAKNLNEKQKDL